MIKYGRLPNGKYMINWPTHGNDYYANVVEMPYEERIEALSRAGVDVSNLFAMQGSGGGEYVVSNKDGKLSILADDDPIFCAILSQGTVPNRRLFRRWVMAQMFHMLSYRDYLCKEPVGVTEMIRRLGYEYQWKMLLSELRAQMKMEPRDLASFSERNRWFNVRVVEAIAQEYVEHLTRYVDELPVKKCKGIPYKRVGGENIFEQDLYNKLYGPPHRADVSGMPRTPPSSTMPSRHSMTCA